MSALMRKSETVKIPTVCQQCLHLICGSATVLEGLVQVVVVVEDQQ